MKYKVCTVIFLSILSANLFANYKQKITVCLNVQSFKTPFKFKLMGESSDIFDGGFTKPYISNGKECKSHTYQHGPKKIKLTLLAHGDYQNKLDLISEDNWRFHYVAYKNYEAFRKHVKGKDVIFNCSLTQERPRIIGKYSHRIACQINE